MSEQRRFKRGEVILRENDLGETAFIIEKGLVEAGALATIPWCRTTSN